MFGSLLAPTATAATISTTVIGQHILGIANDYVHDSVGVIEVARVLKGLSRNKTALIQAARNTRARLRPK